MSRHRSVSSTSRRSRIQATFGRHRQKPQDDANPLREHLPGHQIAVVLELRQQDFVARLQQSAPGIRQQIDRGRRPIGEDDLVRRGSIQKARDMFACLTVSRGRCACPPMDNLMDVRAGIDFEAPHGFQHRFRHLRGRRVVEIMQTGIRKTGKFALEGEGVERLGAGHQSGPTARFGRDNSMMVQVRMARPISSAKLSRNIGTRSS
jgi:hypothetical protein